jgi:hypothetical protein
MPTAPDKPGSPFPRVAEILAAGLARLWAADDRGFPNLDELSRDRLEPAEHAAISVPGGERVETGESRTEVTHGG